MILRRLRRTGWAAGLALVGLVASGAAASAPAGATESAVKATYLYKFAPFVEWPASAFPTPSSPFYLCVLGEDPFNGVLDQAVNGQFVDEHPVAVRRLRSGEVASGCHILYLGASPGKSPADAIRDLRGAPVLTVSDRSLGVRGAIIQFIVQAGHVRFSIDPAAAAAHRVTISSKLMRLAIAVGPGG